MHVLPGTRIFPHLPDFDAAALQRVTVWVDGAHDMFLRSGLHEAAALPPIEIDFAPFSPAAEMRTNSGYMLLGTFSKRDVPSTRSADLVRHEYAHYVLGRTLLPQAVSSPQSAAMHESLGDTFAAVLDDDWTMGEDLHEHGRVTRSMERPADGAVPISFPADRLPSSMAEVTSDMSPHAIVGIPNHAAYLVGTRLGRERLASLYVDALRGVQGTLGFRTFADATLAAARSDDERAVVRDAWQSVGVLTSPA